MHSAMSAQGSCKQKITSQLKPSGLAQPQAFLGRAMILLWEDGSNPLYAQILFACQKTELAYAPGESSMNSQSMQTGNKEICVQYLSA